jgi:protein-L-isoaspartate(D-aspartate) O-methyltransferase
MKKKDLIQQLKSQKFSKKIIEAFEKVDRSEFISKKHKKYSYHDIAIPIGKGQTISQPYTIAFMLTLLKLKNSQKILEVGTGSGYVLALINEISKNSEIYGIERIKELMERSKKILEDKKNIKVIQGDGSKGLPKVKGKGFDRILVSASAQEIPQKLVKQLKIRGILVAPVRNSIIVVKKYSKKNEIREYPGFRFVPLIES